MIRSTLKLSEPKKSRKNFNIKNCKILSNEEEIKQFKSKLCQHIVKIETSKETDTIQESYDKILNALNLSLQQTHSTNYDSKPKKISERTIALIKRRQLTSEFVEVMDGESSDMFAYFKILILRGLIAARKHCDQIIHLVDVMRMGGQLACLRSSSAVSSFRARFHLGRTEPQLRALVDRLVRDALHSLSTRLYDNYQYYTNGIL
ncbi:unnamed protein product [Euphydryas editha]|uniref:Uncharacterized protein n=1 Tax=Euphydryas editha TaxID=104508 RepID=A0AAU9V5M8_EUPED|nr:unnamed protein product [Euphydryas editha]